jgi:hypothetical protein
LKGNDFAIKTGSAIDRNTLIQGNLLVYNLMPSLTISPFLRSFLRVETDARHDLLESKIKVEAFGSPANNS